MKEKKRLDTVLVEKGLVTGRDKAKAVVMAGLVYVDHQREDKPGTQIGKDALVELRGTGAKYVSRGGLKLEKAMIGCGLKLDGLVCMDIGASTGGFTDCMLKNGAKKVYAVDVGYGQLAYSIRSDDRVVAMERTNIRYVTKEDIPEELDFISIDVSFISLKLVIPVAAALLKQHGELVCLIKPQFEAGRESVGKKGVVKDIDVHRDVVEKVAGFAFENGFSVQKIDYSPIKGPEGNIEYLMYMIKNSHPERIKQSWVERVVALSHAALEVK